MAFLFSTSYRPTDHIDNRHVINVIDAFKSRAFFINDHESQASLIRWCIMNKTKQQPQLSLLTLSWLFLFCYLSSDNEWRWKYHALFHAWNTNSMFCIDKFTRANATNGQSSLFGHTHMVILAYWIVASHKSIAWNRQNTRIQVCGNPHTQGNSMTSLLCRKYESILNSLRIKMWRTTVFCWLNLVAQVSKQLSIAAIRLYHKTSFSFGFNKQIMRTLITTKIQRR